ncbi:DUF262 domain-containing protein [Deinococcus peraridilitoris]|uniref:DUF262 domain-containing protein n=1 Tax=Deinococcus peraridilitoris (strain DSM 19664 / LMG 22246 / CIP 109416 / KR-200) TaxID=937777 RepID=L0A0I8_DEIPD|nr:DUF262 domain-containing protein [Deinococcus peraridilitoris]AFZ67408.1 hypothetical protein Deipe_1900 [Deinococcus peraridilitoris DSM 19664]
MRPDKQGLYELFERQERYTVPLYQRRYVWSQDRQWEPLWSDIRSRAEAVIEGGRIRPHFLGAIVLSPVRTFGRELHAKEVIDGQQRLTTFQLFLAAFRDISRDADPDLHAELVNLTDNSVGRKREEERFKVWPTRFDQPAFQRVLLSGDPQDVSSWVNGLRDSFTHVPRVALAYLYFHHQLREWFEGNGREGMNRLEALYEALRRHLQVVTIDLEEDDDPQVIFETLNARGERLLPSDLVRNHIFSRAAREESDVQRLYDTYWAEFDRENGFWRKEVQRGRLKRENLSWFLQHLLTFKLGEDIGEAHLFDAFKRWWSGSYANGRTEEGLQELQRQGEAYRRLAEPDASSRLGVLARRLDSLDISTLHPLLMYLLTDAGTDNHQLEMILADLESFVVRRFVVGLNSKNYNRLFVTLIQSLRDQGGAPHPLVRSFLNAGEGDSVRWPGDAEFRQSFLYDPAYLRLRPRGVATVLEALDVHLTTGKQEKLLLADRPSVEHVLPRKWHDNWSPPMAREGVADPEAWRNRILHSFGNLTLLTKSLNSSVSNASYEVKRPRIAQQSALRLNVFFQDQNSWDEDVIESRGLSLFEVAQQVWPHPGEFRAEPGRSLAAFVSPDTAVRQAAGLVADILPPGLTVSTSREGFRIHHSGWPKRLHYAVRTVDEDERIRVALYNTLPDADSRKEIAASAMQDLKPLVELDFSEQELLFGRDEWWVWLTVMFEAETSADRLVTALLHLIGVTSPRISQLLGTAVPTPRDAARPALDLATQALLERLPKGYTLNRDNIRENRHYRKVYCSKWPRSIHLELLDGSVEGILLVSFHDETGRKHPAKERMWGAYREVHHLAVEHFREFEVRSGSFNGSGDWQWLDVRVPIETAPEAVAEVMLRLLHLVEPVVTGALRGSEHQEGEPSHEVS